MVQIKFRDVTNVHQRYRLASGSFEAKSTSPTDVFKALGDFIEAHPIKCKKVPRALKFTLPPFGTA